VLTMKSDPVGVSSGSCGGNDGSPPRASPWSSC